MVLKESDLAGCVVLYNPSDIVVQNIESYLPYLKELIVIDNSETYNYMLVNYISNHTKIHYQNNKSNLGIANALNKACCIAKKKTSIGF